MAIISFKIKSYQVIHFEMKHLINIKK